MPFEREQVRRGRSESVVRSLEGQPLSPRALPLGCVRLSSSTVLLLPFFLHNIAIPFVLLLLPLRFHLCCYLFMDDD